MASQTIRVKRELLDSFKAACAARGDAVNAVFRVAMEDYTAGRYQPETRCKLAADNGSDPCSAQDQTGGGGVLTAEEYRSIQMAMHIANAHGYNPPYFNDLMTDIDKCISAQETGDQKEGC